MKVIILVGILRLILNIMHARIQRLFFLAVLKVLQLIVVNICVLRSILYDLILILLIILRLFIMVKRILHLIREVHHSHVFFLLCIIVIL